MIFLILLFSKKKKFEGRAVEGGGKLSAQQELRQAIDDGEGGWSF